MIEKGKRFTGSGEWARTDAKYPAGCAAVAVTWPWLLAVRRLGASTVVLVSYESYARDEMLCGSESAGVRSIHERENPNPEFESGAGEANRYRLCPTRSEGCYAWYPYLAPGP